MCVPGDGISAASRFKNSVGAITSSVTPEAFGHGRGSAYTTSPDSFSDSRSCENGARSP